MADSIAAASVLTSPSSLLLNFPFGASFPAFVSTWSFAHPAANRLTFAYGAVGSQRKASFKTGTSGSSTCTRIGMRHCMSAFLPCVGAPFARARARVGGGGGGIQ